MIFNPNTCSCTGTATSVVSPCFSNDECCLKLCNILLDDNTPVEPCDNGTLYEINITQYITVPNCCDIANIVLTTPVISENIKDVSFTKIGNEYFISFRSNWSAGMNFISGEIRYEITCGLLKNQAYLVIPFEQASNDVCNGSYNACTGVCIDTEPVNVTCGDTAIATVSTGCTSVAFTLDSFDADRFTTAPTLDPTTGELTYDCECSVDSDTTTVVTYTVTGCGLTETNVINIMVPMCLNISTNPPGGPLNVVAS